MDCLGSSEKLFASLYRELVRPIYSILLLLRFLLLVKEALGFKFIYRRYDVARIFGSIS